MLKDCIYLYCSSDEKKVACLSNTALIPAAKATTIHSISHAQNVSSIFQEYKMDRVVFAPQQGYCYIPPNVNYVLLGGFLNFSNSHCFLMAGWQLHVEVLTARTVSSQRYDRLNSKLEALSCFSQNKHTAEPSLLNEVTFPSDVTRLCRFILFLNAFPLPQEKVWNKNITCGDIMLDASDWNSSIFNWVAKFIRHNSFYSPMNLEMKRKER